MLKKEPDIVTAYDLNQKLIRELIEVLDADPTDRSREYLQGFFFANITLNSEIKKLKEENQ